MISLHHIGCLVGHLKIIIKNNWRNIECVLLWKLLQSEIKIKQYGNKICKHLLFSASYLQIQNHHESLRYVAGGHILSWIKGCCKAWLMVIRLPGSSIRIWSNRSFSWTTFFRWSSGKAWRPTMSIDRSLVGLMVLMTVIFSCRKRSKVKEKHAHTPFKWSVTNICTAAKWTGI